MEASNNIGRLNRNGVFEDGELIRIVEDGRLRLFIELACDHTGYYYGYTVGWSIGSSLAAPAKGREHMPPARTRQEAIMAAKRYIHEKILLPEFDTEIQAGANEELAYLIKKLDYKQLDPFDNGGAA